MKVPSGATLLANTVSTVASARWRTSVWRDEDGSYGASLADLSAPDDALCARHTDIPSLEGLDELLAEDLRRSSCRGASRIAGLHSAASACTAALLKAA